MEKILPVYHTHYSVNPSPPYIYYYSHPYIVVSTCLPYKLQCQPVSTYGTLVSTVSPICYRINPSPPYITVATCLLHTLQWQPVSPIHTLQWQPVSPIHYSGNPSVATRLSIHYSGNPSHPYITMEPISPIHYNLQWQPVSPIHYNGNPLPPYIPAANRLPYTLQWQPVSPPTVQW
jgi:hypothetical protein